MTSNTENAWEPLFAQMSDAYAEALERNVDAQVELMDAWSESIDRAVDDDLVREGTEGVVAAYEVWMDAAEEAFARTEELARGEEVEAETFRDIWLDAANRAFKRVMETSAFAAATGESVDAALDVQRAFDDARQDALHSYGLATTDDVREVGGRLVELERRQQRVEEKVDRLLDAVES